LLAIIGRRKTMKIFHSGLAVAAGAVESVRDIMLSGTAKGAKGPLGLVTGVEMVFAEISRRGANLIARPPR
jgi:hypothetical protein